MRGLFGKVVSFAVISVIALAIWKGSDGSLATLADTVVGLLSKGADAVLVVVDAVGGMVEG